MPPALELRGVEAAYGATTALFSVSLVVPAGQVVALLGPNGAGKTSTLRVLCGQLSPRGGQVLADGTDVTGHSVRQMAGLGVCLIPEGRGIFPGLTVAENLQMHSHLRPGVPARELAEIAYARFPKLRDRRKQLAGTMSGGEQHMLALSRALTTDPKVLLIDELSMGLAPVLVEELFEVVRGIAREGRTILLVEQLADYALEVADYAYLMRLGEMVAVGQPADVSGLIAELYVGGAGAGKPAGGGPAGAAPPGGRGEPADPDALVVTPEGTLVHRAGCPVVAGRADVRPPAAGAEPLDGCRICGGA
jgi:branched-chain amino acid transport system ATP-binding protein